MKIITMLFVLLSVALYATVGFAEQETLFGGNVEYGAYLGPDLKVSAVNGDIGILPGGRVGITFNHAFALSLAGYGLANNVESDAPYEDRNIMMGYYGLVPEYVFNAQKPVNVSVSALVGGGGLRAKDPGVNTMEHDMDIFFVAEPALTVYLNVVNHVRVGLGAGYRFVSGIGTEGLDSSEIGGVFGILSLQIGAF